ncbi:hypothetical protein GC170_09875 [bacterium]|nr:hypothetical protein [bacterium]
MLRNRRNGYRPTNAQVLIIGSFAMVILGLKPEFTCVSAFAQDLNPAGIVETTIPADLESAFGREIDDEGLIRNPVQAEGADLAVDRDSLIETDRNAFTISPRTVGRNVRVLESTYTYIGVGKSGSKYSFPEVMLRVGLTDRLEARLGYNFETGTATQASEGDIVNGFGIDAEQQAFYGFKYQITELNEKWRLLPESVILVQGHTPMGSIAGQTQIRCGGAWGWELPRGMQLSQSFRFGTDREENDNYTLWSPSTALKIPLTPTRRWFTQLEYYSVMSASKEVDFSMQFIDTGLHYLPNPNFEIGAMIGFGLNDQTRGVILNVGFGYRF